MKKILTLLALTLVTAPAFAQNVYLGGGLSSNEINGSDEGTGWQVFAGFPLTGIRAEPFQFAIEAGYMETGEMETRTNVPLLGTVTTETEAKGLWATGVASYPLASYVDLLGRIGLDFGDDDGLMVGVGLGFTVSREIQVRGEYVERDNVDSLQLNLVYYLGGR